MTSEDLYTLWHRETFKAKGTRVRKVKNFDKAKASGNWEYFESFSLFVKRNNGSIDPELYMRAVALHFGGYFKPSLLGSQKTIKIYKNYIQEMKDNADTTSEVNIKEEILKSIKFINKFCRKRGLKSFSEYLEHDMYMIPSIIKHYNAGSISIYFLSSIDNFPIILTNYPTDVIKDYMGNFNSEFGKYRLRVMTNEHTKRIAKNLEEIFEKCLKKQ